ncbi:hypothetical protein [Mangrovihabitans endophyticus]|uniref:Uncharacterized protein n=1 Tax=Mangrovihabitans endophyticus TaxID=1751298 RepID=A0A8J3FLT1_9ACTN|nr:hypothetical protein [Mangrovihabitans endophyticus]GGK74525.1 hypothetical protein GCM10012284_05600 [Mangrovihabitans endophyticus]
MMEWGSVHSRRFVLPAESGFDTVNGLADDVGAGKVRDASPVAVAGLIREVTWRLSPSNFLHYGLDAPTHRSYVQVTGSEDEAVAEFSGIVSEYLDVADDDALISAADAARTVDERREALIVLGMGAPLTVDTRFASRLDEGLHDNAESVREGALYGAAYALWPPLMTSVRRMAADDPAEAIRRQAQALTDWLHENSAQS